MYTIEEMERLHLPEGGAVCKNLFLRDYKGKNHYLVVLRKDKRADLKALAALLGSTPLTSASPERLRTRLGWRRGPYALGVVHDDGHTVRVILDRDLQEEMSAGGPSQRQHRHRRLRPAELEAYIRDCGNPMEWMTL